MPASRFFIIIQFITMLFVLPIIPQLASAVITPTSSISTLSPFIAKGTTDTLFIFDIDMVLAQPSEPSFQLKSLQTHNDLIKKMLIGLSELEIDHLYMLFATTTRPMAVESQTSKIIAKINQKGLKSIGLTAMLSGQVGEVRHLPTWRGERLAEQEIQLGGAFPQISNFVFQHLPAYSGSRPEYHRGVVYANGPRGPVDKGTALLAFFDQAKWKPKHVIFVDDKRKNLELVESALASYDQQIQFNGLHYTAANKFPAKAVSSEQLKEAWRERITRAKRSAAAAANAKS